MNCGVPSAFPATGHIPGSGQRLTGLWASATQAVRASVVLILPRRAHGPPVNPTGCSKKAQAGTPAALPGGLARACHRWLALLAGCLWGVGAWACPEPALALRPLAPGLWWVPAHLGEADATNRGHIANILVGVDGSRVWVLGSGPSPAFGQRLNCTLRQRLGRGATDVISPWPHPELVAGVKGLLADAGGHGKTVRHWAHAEVAQAMRQSCNRCVAQMARRLGAAAADLGDDPIHLPVHRVRGDRGQLGPWRWWRLVRAPGMPVTVWWWRGAVRGGAPSATAAPLHAPGLLWSPGAPDGADSSAQWMADATEAAMRLHRGLGGGRPLAWLGEQGEVLAPDAAQEQARYWRSLLAAVAQSLDAGDDGSAPAPELPGLAALSTGVRHQLNWQRTWRQEEERSFQRSRR